MICDNIKIGGTGHLFFAGKDVVSLSQAYGTPVYLMDEQKIREKCRIYKNTLFKNFGEKALPLYAGKALCFKGLYRIINEEEMGIDVVSFGEIYVADSAGFPMEKAFFHGNNKTASDIAYAMDCGVGYFVCDGEDELELIEKEANKHGIKQKILIRVSPGIDAHTHSKINTGMEDSKFGLSITDGKAMNLAKLALNKENVLLKGFHCHIGSQIFESSPFVEAVKIMMGFIKNVKDTLGYETEMLDLGGGIGVRYIESDPVINIEDVINEISATIKNEVQKLSINTPFILVEPGRSIVADSGMTLYTAGDKKEISGVRNYLAIDGGMADNPRYTLYGSKYSVFNASRMNEAQNYECTIAGRCCESGDLIQENVKIANPKYGDIIAVATTGAYNYSMSSNYNMLPKPPIVMINGDSEYIAVERESFEDIVKNQL